MNRQHYLETINTVLAWDLPEEAFIAEVNKLVTSDIDLKYVPPTPIKKSATTLPLKKSKQA